MKLFFSFLLLLLFASCEKSLENFRSEPAMGADTIWTNQNIPTLAVNQLQTQLSRPATIDSFSLTTGGSLLTNNGLQVEIPANAFTTSLTGNAQVEMFCLRRKGDLIRTGKPTLHSNGSVLQTAATCYLNISKNGQVLLLATGKHLRLTLADSAPLSSSRAFTGEPPVAGSFKPFGWQPTDSLSLTSNSGGYQLNSNRQQWLSIAAGFDTAAAYSRAVLSMPAVYTNLNTLAFIVFKDATAVVQLAPDTDRRIWITPKIPAGKSVLYLTLTKKGSDYWLGTQEITTSYNQHVHITPQKTTLPAIGTLLDGL